MNVGELTADEEWQIIDDSEHSLQEDHAMPDKDMDLEQSDRKKGEHKSEDTGVDTQYGS